VSDHPHIVAAERDGLASIDDEYTILQLEATYTQVPLDVAANKRRKTVTVEIGRESRELDLREAYTVVAAILSGTDIIAPTPAAPAPVPCVDCGADAETLSDEYGARLCVPCMDTRTEGWMS
jgi:hypothetical protein